MRRAHSAQIDNETEYNETDDSYDLDRCKIEFAFAKGTGAQKVYDENNDKDDGNPDSIEVGIGVPVYEHSSALLTLTKGDEIMKQDLQLMRTAAADNSAGRVTTHAYQ